MSLGDGVDQRAGLDLVRAPRLVVSVETAVEHLFPLYIWGMKIKPGVICANAIRAHD